MTEKNADIHTIAPRLHGVEDRVDYLWNNRNSGSGSGTSTYDTKLWRATVEGAEPGVWSSQPWTQTDLIYGPDSTNGMSMHMTIFSTDSSRATACQDGKGFHGWVFPANETRWKYGPSQGNNVTLATDIFGNAGGGGYIENLRAASQTLCAAIFGSPSNINRDNTIISRLQGLSDRITDLSSELTRQVNLINTQISSINSQLVSIRSRLTNGGL